MEKYTNVGSSKTPTINFDLIGGVLEIKGRSIPENSIEFYKPLMESLDKYSLSAKPATAVSIGLEYFNTSSSKCILDVFKKLENIQKAGSAVTINWNYEEDDEDMLEAGEDYQAIISIPFKMVQVTQ
jgi:hypothetical protein